jgi:hypothetical protein
MGEEKLCVLRKRKRNPEEDDFPPRPRPLRNAS